MDVPLASDAIDQAVDAVARDAACFEHAAGHGAVDGLECCESIALDLPGVWELLQHRRPA